MTEVENIARFLSQKLRPLCKRLRVAGSIRRHEKNPQDIDIVLIPKNREKLEEFLSNKLSAKYMQGGEFESTWRFKGVKVELYYTNEKEFGAELLSYSGKKGSNIGLRLVAKRKGLKLTNHGLFNAKTGRRIAGKTEKEIYAALDRPYKKPEDR